VFTLNRNRPIFEIGNNYYRFSPKLVIIITTYEFSKKQNISHEARQEHKASNKQAFAYLCGLCETIKKISRKDRKDRKGLIK
jgi:hypothetical protein